MSACAQNQTSRNRLGVGHGFGGCCQATRPWLRKISDMLVTEIQPSFTILTNGGFATREGMASGRAPLKQRLRIWICTEQGPLRQRPRSWGILVKFAVIIYQVACPHQKEIPCPEIPTLALGLHRRMPTIRMACRWARRAGEGVMKVERSVLPLPLPPRTIRITGVQKHSGKKKEQIMYVMFHTWVHTSQKQAPHLPRPEMLIGNPQGPLGAHCF